MKHHKIQHLRAFIRSAALLVGVLIPARSLAESHFMHLNACWGGIACDSVEVVGVRFNIAFIASAGLIALSVFLIGAFLMTISGGKDTLLQAGKRAMINSLIGLALVVGCYALYRTAVLLYS